ncbi:MULTISPECIES: PadR family transcriptional regulator [unclassified Sporolactobacillus]|uniref:PadR family transcriptional regulator n=1 Tax=unclassified Sporolactobacillus TaxID=2628533 RepID=UPI0023683E76|nr:PadR family transcriptional regulator [Sporolactobacillus sp. CQH2019]MDD9149082.1 PadR family transcriptional regulator [Sporolactobacillus sp. CQH2019]
MNVSKDLIAASAVPLILAILRQGDSYGYSIIKRVKELSENELVWSEGMLYPVLHRLEDQNFIQSYWKSSETGRRRKYYTIKDGGLKELELQKKQWNMVHSALSKTWRKPNQE